MKLILLLFTVFLASCSQNPPVDPAENSTTEVYDCADNQRLVANFHTDSVWIFAPTKTLQLNPSVSASGAKYSDKLGNMFWQHQGEALATIAGTRYQDCKLNRRASIWEGAKLRGIDYRAVGQEPPWTLEISNRTQLLLLTGYEQTPQRFTLSDPETDQQARTTVYRSQGVTLTIEGQNCNDSMSGEAFESTVILTVNDKRYRGCGRTLH